MAGEIETLKRIKEAEEEAARKISEAEEAAKNEIDEANTYYSSKITEAEENGKRLYEKAIAEANAKASKEVARIVDDARARAKGIKHIDPDKALEVFEEEVLEEFGV